MPVIQPAMLEATILRDYAAAETTKWGVCDEEQESYDDLGDYDYRQYAEE